jgi:hypothetical protein
MTFMTARGRGSCSPYHVEFAMDQLIVLDALSVSALLLYAFVLALGSSCDAALQNRAQTRGTV